MLHLRPYKTAVVHERYDTDREARLNFLHWYFCVVHAGHLSSMLLLLSKDAVRVTGTGLQKNCTSMPEVPLCGVVIGVWSLVRAFKMYIQ